MLEIYKFNNRYSALPVVLFLLTGVTLTVSVAALFTCQLIAYSHIVTNRNFANYWANYWPASKLRLDADVLDLFRGEDIHFRHALDTYGENFPGQGDRLRRVWIDGWQQPIA